MGEENIINISNKTHELDNEAVASMVQDAVKSSIDLQAGVRNKIEMANYEDGKTDINVEIAKMRKKGFSKELAESVKAATLRVVAANFVIIRMKLSSHFVMNPVYDRT